jgi:glucose-6-phosphate 1-dehydrogenase
MEPPSSFAAETVRDEKAKVLRAIHPISPEEVLHHAVRGQYGPGMVGGDQVPGYREEPNVSSESKTDTFAALRVEIDSWRWAGVPFYIRTGKRLAKRLTEITIQFKQVPLSLFRDSVRDGMCPNLLVLHIQPKEGISLRFGAKLPGPGLAIRDVNMDFDYADYFGKSPSTGYETLLYDCMCGDATLFQRADAVELGWSVVQPVLVVWAALTPRDFPNYASGSWGPREADELLARDGREWRNG